MRRLLSLFTLLIPFSLVIPALALAALSVLLAWPLAAPTEAASKLVWDRNVEPDMDHYNVYGCFAKGCTVTQDSASKVGTVAQVPVGSIPEFPLPAGQEGALAVSAVDQAVNESDLSVPVPFDAKAPAVPVNPRLQ